MKNLKYILMGTFCMGMFSCTNLDEEIKGDFVEDFDPANQGVGVKNNVNKPTPNDGLTSAFNKLFDGTATNGGFFNVQELSSDEAVIAQKGGDWYDGGDFINIHKHNFTPLTVSTADAWDHAYGGIVECNRLLATTLNASQTAQLKALRAYFYWRLLDLFGNVPITTTTGAGGSVPQSTRAQVYDFVVAELNAAIPNLPSIKADYGRINQAGAYGLLSRVHLNSLQYKGVAEYQKAIDAADMVINSTLYNLSADYAKVFSPDNVENVEHIFIVPYDEATGQGMSFAQQTLHYPSQLTYKLQEQPWNGFATLEAFYNSYEAADKRRANNFIVGPQVDVDGNPILDLAFDPADQDGPAINYTPFINELFPNSSRQGGARLGKFAFKVGQSRHMDNDWPILRYGEVLLNKAEALCRLNGYGDATALTLVNQLRTRAGVGTIAPLDADKMLAERGRELFMECLRRTDLIRFGKWGAAWWEKPAHANVNFNIFAIPKRQMDATNTSANPLVQNPGY